MNFKKKILDIYNSSAEFISTKYDQYEIQREIDKQSTTTNTTKNNEMAMVILITDPNRYQFKDLLIVILNKIPKNSSKYSISFEFFGQDCGDRQMFSRDDPSGEMYHQVCDISTNPRLYADIYRGYVFMREKYEFDHFTKFEVRIDYLCEKNDKTLIK